jgi:hypothetical protein
MFRIFPLEISKMWQFECEYLENVSKDHEKARLEVEARRNDLMSREKDLQKRQEDNYNERNELFLESCNLFWRFEFMAAMLIIFLFKNLLNTLFLIGIFLKI